MWVPLPRVIYISETGHQNSPMVKNKRFSEFSGQGYPVLKFDGQNQTRAIVRWPKINFILFEMFYAESSEVGLVLGVICTIVTLKNFYGAPQTLTSTAPHTHTHTHTHTHAHTHSPDIFILECHFLLPFFFSIS